MSKPTSPATLRENVEWQTRNFDASIEAIKHILNHFLDIELPHALRRIDYSGDSIVGCYTHSDAAADIVHCLIQSVNNAGMGRLTTSAGDLTTTKMTLIALDNLPDDIRDKIVALEQKEAFQIAAQRAADRLAREEREGKKCQGMVHVGGRGVGFRQCQNNATGKVEFEGRTYRTCKKHRDGFRPYEKTTKTLDLKERT
jgi:hypothetical protein